MRKVIKVVNVQTNHSSKVGPVSNAMRKAIKVVNAQNQGTSQTRGVALDAKKIVTKEKIVLNILK